MFRPSFSITAARSSSKFVTGSLECLLSFSVIRSCSRGRPKRLPKGLPIQRGLESYPPETPCLSCLLPSLSRRVSLSAHAVCRYGDLHTAIAAIDVRKANATGGSSPPCSLPLALSRPLSHPLSLAAAAHTAHPKHTTANVVHCSRSRLT